jgi:hypothetical protein
MKPALAVLIGGSLVVMAISGAFWVAAPVAAQQENAVRLYTGGSRVSRPSATVDYNDMMITVRLQEMISVGDKQESSNVLRNINSSVSIVIRRDDGTDEGLSDAADIAQGLEATVRAAVIKSIKPGTALSDSSLANLPERIRSAAQAAFMADFDDWVAADDFEAEVLLTEFYATDLSVGRRPSFPPTP